MQPRDGRRAARATKHPERGLRYIGDSFFPMINMLIRINHYFRDPVIKQPRINGKSQGFLFVAQMGLPIGSAGWEFPQMVVSFVMGLVKE